MIGNIISIIFISTICAVLIIWGTSSVVETVLKSKGYELFEEVQRLKKENRKLQKQIKELEMKK